MWCSDREDTFHSVVVIDVWCLSYTASSEETLKGPFQVRGWSVLRASKARTLQDVRSSQAQSPRGPSARPQALWPLRSPGIVTWVTLRPRGLLEQVNVSCLQSEEPSCRAAHTETTGGVPCSLGAWPPLSSISAFRNKRGKSKFCDITFVPHF